ncbi:MAG TPA: DEAD/DEAH box helicase [Candidatus Deferrimicrobium sp.]|nr:DEAD/DEAH box helicase [Candidatus Deferrimicrobium sp.]
MDSSSNEKNRNEYPKLMNDNWQIRIQWRDRFPIEAEKLELDNFDNQPFKIINLKKIFGKDFVPYKIQTQAWTEILKILNPKENGDGNFLFLVSGTGSGKTLVILSILEVILRKEGTHCLIIYPTKALAQDQERRLQPICSEYNSIFQRYESSVSQTAKLKIREKQGEILIITPDTLMGSIIGTRNEKWYKYLTRPSMIWIDEFHATSGTLGTALVYLIRLLYTLHPDLRVFFTSATLANVAEIAELLPHPTTIIKGGSRHGNIKFHVGAIKDFKNVLDLVSYDEGQFLIFIENKQKIEQLMMTYDLLSSKINRYHADLPDAERHLILSKFSKKLLKGLLCTSAAGLGIDIPSVKNIVLYGFPRNFSLLFQEMGRGTRNDEASGNIFLLLDESKLIDSYYSLHPEKLRREIKSYRSEPMIIDLLNEKILRRMVLFGIKLGIQTQEQLIHVFKEAYNTGKLEQTLTWLLIKGYLSKNKEGYTFLKEYAEAFLFDFILNLRPGFPKFKIITVVNNQEIELGSINAEDIPYRACKGNYYNKDNQYYFIEEIDLDRREIYVEKTEASYTSKNIVVPIIRMINELKFKEVADLKIRLANFKVQVKPLALKNSKMTEDQGEIPDPEVDPSRYQDNFILTFETRGLTLEFPLSQEKAMSQMVLYQLSKIILQNAALMINISEKEVDCYQNYEKKMISFLDRSCPTGVSQQLYENMEAILKKTYQVLASCSCQRGCGKCAIPVESNYLMPHLTSTDIYRKKEMLSILRRYLHESRSLE